MFQAFSEKTGVPEGYRNPPGRVMGLMGLSGEERGLAKRWHVLPLAPIRIGQGEGAGPPPSFSPLLFPFLSFLD